MPATATKRALKSKKTESLEERIAKHKRALELGKKHYGRADRLLESILPEMPVGERVPLPGGKSAKLVDLFAEKNKVFRAHGIGRYELQVSEAE